MKNLENYGVLEMDAEDIIEVDGGWPIVALVAAAIGVGVAYMEAVDVFYEAGSNIGTSIVDAFQE